LFFRLLVALHLIDDYTRLNFYSALGALAYASSCFLLSPLSDRIGRHKGAAIGLGLCVAGSFFPLLGGGTPAQLFVYNAFGSVGWGLFFPAIEGLVADNSSPKVELGRGISRYNMAWSSGDFIGGLAAAAIIAHWAIHHAHLSREALVAVVFGAGALWDAFLIGCLLWDRRRLRKKNAASAVVRTEHPPATVSPEDLAELPAFSRAARVGFFFASGVLCLTMTNFQRYGSLNGLPKETAAVLFASFPGLNVLLFKWLGPRLFWRFRRAALLTTQLPMLGGSLLLVLFPNPLGLAGGLFLIGFGFAAIFTQSLFYSLLLPHYGKKIRTVANENGKAYSKEGGVHEALLGLGNLLGPVLCLLLWNVAPADLPLWGRDKDAAFFAIGAVLCGVSLAGQWMLLHRDLRMRRQGP
jgi:MFS family permease